MALWRHMRTSGRPPLATGRSTFFIPLSASSIYRHCVPFPGASQSDKFCAFLITLDFRSVSERLPVLLNPIPETVFVSIMVAIVKVATPMRWYRLHHMLHKCLRSFSLVRAVAGAYDLPFCALGNHLLPSSFFLPNRDNISFFLMAWVPFSDRACYALHILMIFLFNVVRSFAGALLLRSPSYCEFLLEIYPFFNPTAPRESASHF